VDPANPAPRRLIPKRAPRGTERLRLAPSPLQTDADIEALVAGSATCGIA